MAKSKRQADRKLRVLVLNYEWPPIGGGGGAVSQEIARGLAEKGHIVDVVTMSYKGLIRKETEQNLTIYRVPCLRSKATICHPWEQLSYLLSAKKKVHELIKQNTYDVCHTHFLIPTGLLSLHLKNKYDIPYIVTIHGSDIPAYNEERFVFLHKFTRPLLREVAENSSLIVSPSQFLLSVMEREVGQYESVVIPNGIRTKKFSPQEKKLQVVSTGRLVARKGFSVLVSAASKIHPKVPIHIVGDGPQREELQHLAGDSVVFHGWLDNSSKKYQRLIEESAIYCLVSEKENNSIALLEGLSAGCAVVTSNSTGCAEAVQGAGCLIPPNNEKALVNILSELLQNRSLRKQLQERSRKRALETFDWDVLVDAYEEVLFDATK